MTQQILRSGTGSTGTGRPLRLAATLAGLGRWQRLGAAALAGAVTTLALPPADLIPVLWLTFPVLLWLLRGTGTPAQAFWTGWAFGFGHHLVGLYWISVALFVDIGKFWPVLPFAVCGLPALLAVYTGIATMAHRWARQRFGLCGAREALALGLLWTVLELARGHLFTGFPWNLIGYVWTDLLPVAQLASVVGVYGLSLLTVCIAALPVVLAEGRPRRWLVPAAGLAVLAAVAAWGAVRLGGTEGRFVDGVKLRLVQAAIPQTLKWDRGAVMANFQKHLDLSTAPGWDTVTHVIWPETAVPWFMGRDIQLNRAVGSVAPPGGLVLTGAPRVYAGPDGEQHYANSLVAVDAAGRTVDVFDKAHLVPFGEYMPFRRWLPVGAVATIAPSAADMTAGPGPRTLLLPGLPPVSPLICYEVIFPGAVIPAAGTEQPRPSWLLNLTNDAWYGQTAGPHQHFAITRMRAIEEGLPLVRAANTGISGVVDAYGRVTARLDLGKSGIIDAQLPRPALAIPPFSTYGNQLLVVALLVVLAAVGFPSRRV
ncbi:apolipoprotein N-acyltransferase [Oleisolibacter albus]|uniref:apolipoprotein N-acyltransferase n=1 Tax=Oleisolibacter albus TaxID=2171757 RepID=UPI000DF41144|nr:apolipoprotein N-acyltransferase [Oleisolibacter albus]